jgi:enoyl-CoA hydratase/carnithine racemase
VPAQKVLLERRGRIALVTLNQAEARNPLDDETVVEFLKVIEEINSDIGLSCMVLTGAGSAFCAGGNVKDMRDKQGLFSGTPAEMRRKYQHGIQRIPMAMHDLEVPAIAAVNGPAVGAGCDLAMMCDIRVASTKASFAESFLRVGLISGDGGAWYLPRVVGLSRAFEMAFTGAPVIAEEARAAGFVSRVVEPDALLDAALALAGQIVQQPPQALRMMKRLIRHGAESSLAQNLELAAAMQPVTQSSGDHHEAVMAFLEKRHPRFEGR